MPLTSSRRSWRLILVVAAMVALMLAVFALLEKQQSAQAAQVQVLVAARDIQINEPITPTMLAVETRPQAALAGMDAALAGDVGLVERSTSRAPIFAGEVIDLRRLYSPGLTTTGDPTEVFLTRGYAFYPLPTDTLALAEPGITAGAYAEIVASLPPLPLTSVEATQGITGTAQPVDAHALITAVQPSPPAVTVMVPQREVPYLAWLIGRHARFSFGLVRPDDASAPLQGVSSTQFERTYHAPQQH